MTKQRKLNDILVITILILLIGVFSCSDNKECGYVSDPNIIPIGCTLQSELNLTTGTDVNGNLIAPGMGVIDPYWKLLNNPPLIMCEGSVEAATINGSAYAINFGNFGPDQWVNQIGATTLAPVDIGTEGSFGCNNAMNSEGKIVPYVFERSFCVLNDTHINFSFLGKGDDQIYYQLINNDNNTVINTSDSYTYYQDPLTWTGNDIALNAGSYSVRAYLANVNSVVLGFTLLGTLTTTNGDKSISNNNEGCCENNTISVLNVIDGNCNNAFDGFDSLGQNWTFKVLNSGNVVVRTGTTDVNGNIFFSGIPNGTYTVQIVTQTGYTSTTTSATVVLSNNIVKIVNFFNCPI
ncbi:MAG TPA: SpaA isopeptide-forming pilin-related protein [Flavobacterium sp.]|uniref:SpaA isopeptide-forming pilin-related protein n=1 Tax=Flavobacterium sp. TaxID=239 RepID=UPI002CBFC2A9|nr:SpaA isopeptide-forming pilin-related protein [Flavobacterium sp.]HNP33888.1 SpaA isopeptide-forming pilin-related protein [Flavobacterium sp.]